MQFYFTEEDHPTDVRGRDIRSALVHAHHRVVRGKPGEPAPAGTDVWMHGIGVEGSPPMDARVSEALLESKAAIAIFQLCDAENMSFERIPAAVAARARVFLRNHWPANAELIPTEFRGRIGLLPPMIKPMAPRPGRCLIERSVGAIFFGTRTGLSNLAGGKNAREEAVRLMRNADLPFVGGILPHVDPRYPTDPALVVERMSEKAHRRLLEDAQVCLAPWGNHPITYRFFEGLALRCLVVAQSLRATRFIDAGLVAGHHYVEVAADLTDLTEKVRYYLHHLDEAQGIADAGHERFKEYLAARGGLVSERIFEETVASWGDLYHPAASRGAISTLRSLAARMFPKKF